MDARDHHEMIGNRIVDYADTVQDMGRRVGEVLERNPRDHHYAASKLSVALEEAARALGLLGIPADAVVELVRDAHEKGERDRRDLERVLAKAREGAQR